MQRFEASIFAENLKRKLIILLFNGSSQKTNSVNVVICSSRLAHRDSSSCSRAFVAELLSVTGGTELIELDIDDDCDGFDGDRCAAVEEDDVVVVVEAKLLLSVLVDMFDSNSFTSNSPESIFIDEYVV